MARFNAYGYHDELRKKRKRREKRIAFLIIFSFVGLILFLTYALIFSGWLSIKEIKISGHQEISEEEIKNFISSHLDKGYFFSQFRPFSNIILARSESIKNSLSKDFLMIEFANINKDFFKRHLNVEINERKTAGIWCQNDSDKCFYFDKNQVLFKPAPKFSGDVFLTIEDSRGRDFNLADRFDDQELFEKINLARNILDDLKIINYSSFFLPKGSFEFWTKTKDGWYIYLDKENDIPTQLVALKKFLEEKLPTSRRQTLEYIDLRVNNRIYYK